RMKKIFSNLLSGFRNSRNFLAISQLRSLRNLSILPEDAVIEVLNSLNLTYGEFSFLMLWNDGAIGTNPNMAGAWLFWIIPPTDESVDDYKYCYTPQFELTQHGQRMKDAAYRAQANAEL